MKTVLLRADQRPEHPDDALADFVIADFLELPAVAGQLQDGGAA